MSEESRSKSYLRKSASWQGSLYFRRLLASVSLVFSFFCSLFIYWTLILSLVLPGGLSIAKAEPLLNTSHDRATGQTLFQMDSKAASKLPDLYRIVIPEAFIEVGNGEKRWFSQEIIRIYAKKRPPNFSEILNEYNRYQGDAQKLTEVTKEDTSKKNRLLQMNYILDQVTTPGKDPRELSQKSIPKLWEGVAERQNLFVKAQAHFRAAAEILSDPRQRAAYDFNSGRVKDRAPEWSWRHPLRSTMERRALVSANRQGLTQVIVEAEGKRYPINVDYNDDGKSQRVAKEIRGSQVMQEVRSGAITMTVMTAVLLSVLHSLAYYKLVTDYAANPTAVEESAETYLTPLMALSFMTFFAGMQGANNLGRVYHRNLENLNFLRKNRVLKNDNPDAWRKAFQGGITGMSTAAVGLGAFMSVSMMYGGSKLLACLDLLHDKPMARDKKEQVAALCDQAWSRYLKESSMDMVRAVIMVMSAHKLIVLSSSRVLERMGAQQGSQGPSFSQQVRDIEGRVKKVKFIVSRGAVVGIQGIVILGGFFLIIDMMERGWQKGVEITRFQIPLHRSSGRTREAFSQFEDDGFRDMDNLRICFKTEGVETCRLEEHFRDYTSKMDNWRNEQLRPLQESAYKWSTVYADALNQYFGSAELYRQLVRQIGFKRRELGGADLPFYAQSPSSLNAQLLREMYISQAFEPLSLFRSAPLFGVRHSSDLLDLESDSFTDPSPERVKEVLEDQLAAIVGIGLEVKRVLEENPPRRARVNQLAQRVLDQMMGLNSRGTLDQRLGQALDLFENIQRGLILEPGVCWGESGVFDRDCFFNPLAFHLTERGFLVEIDQVTKRLKPVKFQPGVQNDPRSLGGLSAQPPYFTSLPPGYRFFMDFRHHLRRNGIDDEWYPETYRGMRVQGIVHYHLLTSLCGPDSKAGPGQIVRERWGRSLSFNPPRLPLKGGVDYCREIKSQSGEAIFQPIRRLAPAEGFISRLSSLFGVPLRKQVDQEYYADIVHLLYNELDEGLNALNFEDWYSQAAGNSLSAYIDRQNEEFQKEFVDNFLGPSLNSSQRTWALGLPKGYFQSIREELEVLFSDFAAPIFDSAEWDPSKNVEAISQSPRQFFYDHYQSVIYNFNFIFSSPSLRTSEEIIRANLLIAATIEALGGAVGISRSICSFHLSHDQVQKFFGISEGDYSWWILGGIRPEVPRLKMEHQDQRIAVEFLLARSCRLITEANAAQLLQELFLEKYNQMKDDSNYIYWENEL